MKTNKARRRVEKQEALKGQAADRTVALDRSTVMAFSASKNVGGRK